MREGLSIEGLLQQSQRVLVSRGPWLLLIAVIWVLVVWVAAGLPMWLMMAGVIKPAGPGLAVMIVIDAAINAAGSAIMIGAVARTGLPHRPPGLLLLHAAFAAATVALALIIFGGGSLLMQSATASLFRADGQRSAPSGSVAILVPAIYQFGLFAFLGMAIPAATERLISPWRAAKVSLRLTEGHRLWLGVIAVVWTVVMAAPVYGMKLLTGSGAHAAPPTLLFGQMLAAVGIGVLYLELRRLRTAGSPEATAETFG